MRKKQPELVRSQLLEATAEIIASHGLAAVTLDAAARLAGVSKGGLLHHFPSRQALIEGVFKEITRRFEENIDRLAAADPEPRGRFSRAYLLAAVLPGDPFLESRLLGAWALVMGERPELAAYWRDWLSGQIRRHGEDENSVPGRLVRYAADGLWLAEGTGSGGAPEDQRAVIEALLKISKTI